MGRPPAHASGDGGQEATPPRRDRTRQWSKRRRRLEPSCSDTVYSDEQSEVLRAATRWRAEHPGRFIMITDMLDILIELGYHKDPPPPPPRPPPPEAVAPPPAEVPPGGGDVGALVEAPGPGGLLGWSIGYLLDHA